MLHGTPILPSFHRYVLYIARTTRKKSNNTFLENFFSLGFYIGSLGRGGGREERAYYIAQKFFLSLLLSFASDIGEESDIARKGGGERDKEFFLVKQ